MRFTPFLLLPLILAVFSPLTALSQDISAEWIINVQENGDAVVEIKIAIPLESQEEWSSLNFDASAYKELFSEVVQSASQRTGREMEIQQWSVEKEFAGDHGVIIISFIWKNFCSQENGKLVIEDVLEGLYVPEGYTLKIVAPQSMRIAEINPAPDEMHDSSAIFSGPKTLSISASFESVETPGFELLAALLGTLLSVALLRRRN